MVYESFCVSELGVFEPWLGLCELWKGAIRGRVRRRDGVLRKVSITACREIHN
jgi:hypothetical protein